MLASVLDSRRTWRILQMAAASPRAGGAQPAQEMASVTPALADGVSPATPSIDVEEILASLTPRERRVLQLRFGFVDCQERTVEEVGKRMGVACERIISIEQDALNKLADLVDAHDPRRAFPTDAEQGARVPVDDGPGGACVDLGSLTFSTARRKMPPFS